MHLCWQTRSTQCRLCSPPSRAVSLARAPAASGPTAMQLLYLPRSLASSLMSCISVPAVCTVALGQKHALLACRTLACGRSTSACEPAVKRWPRVSFIARQQMTCTGQQWRQSRLVCKQQKHEPGKDGATSASLGAPQKVNRGNQGRLARSKSPCDHGIPKLFPRRLQELFDVLDYGRVYPLVFTDSPLPQGCG